MAGVCKPAGVAGRVYKGRGQGTDIDTLQKPLPPAGVGRV